MDQTKEGKVRKIRLRPTKRLGRPPKHIGKEHPNRRPVDPLRHLVAKRAHLKRVANNPDYGKKNAATLAEARVALAKSGPPRLGVPTGWTRVKAQMQREYDRCKADLILEKMRERGMLDPLSPGDFERVTVVTEGGKSVEVLVPKTDNAKADAALREAMVHAISPLTNAKDRATYIRTVLEYTRAKPAQKTDLRVNDPNAWLEAAMQDAANSDDTDNDDTGADQAP